MTSITIASIETTIADLFHAAITRVQTIGTALASVAGKAETAVNAAAPVAAAVLAVVAPQDVAAVAVAKAAMNALDAAVEAAGTSAAGGVTLSLPAELVADWKAAKAGLVAFESVL